MFLRKTNLITQLKTNTRINFELYEKSFDNRIGPRGTKMSQKFKEHNY